MEKVSGEDKIVIHQLEDAWGVLSVDPFSSAVQMYCKLAGISYEVVNDNNEGISVNGRLPVVEVLGKRTYQEDEVYSYLQDIRNLSSHLSQEKRAIELSFIYLIDEPLYYSMLHSWWLTENYADIKPIYSSFSPFPLNVWIVHKKFSKIEKKLDVLGYTDEKAQATAATVYDLLSQLLGNSPYFFGDQPSLLDAVAFGHLSVQYFAAVKRNYHRQLLDKHHNLKQYILRNTEIHLSSKPSVTESDELVIKAERTRDYWNKAIFMGSVSIMGVMLARSAYTH